MLVKIAREFDHVVVGAIQQLIEVGGELVDRVPSVGLRLRSI